MTHAVNSCSALFQHTPMLQQTGRHTHISDRIKVKKRERKKEVPDRLNAISSTDFALPFMQSSTELIQNELGRLSVYRDRAGRAKAFVIVIVVVFSPWHGRGQSREGGTQIMTERRLARDEQALGIFSRLLVSTASRDEKKVAPTRMGRRVTD